MPLITFTSDYGLSDHYVAKVKGYIKSTNPESTIIDVSHEIKPYDIGHMAHVVKSVYAAYPEGTVHLVGGEPQSDKRGILICFIEGHWFVLPDNGLVSLIADRPLHQVLGIDTDGAHVMKTLGETVAKLANGDAAEGLGSPVTDYLQFTSRKARYKEGNSRPNYSFRSLWQSYYQH